MAKASKFRILRGGDTRRKCDQCGSSIKWFLHFIERGCINSECLNYWKR